MTQSDNRRVVYTTDGGRVDYCARCGAPAHAGRCAPRPADVPAQRSTDGAVRLARDRKGRRGKTVTTITGFPGDEVALRELAQTLKKLCGSGGAVKDGHIEIQGDHRDRLAGYLTEQGHRVMLVGG